MNNFLVNQVVYSLLRKNIAAQFPEDELKSFIVEIAKGIFNISPYSYVAGNLSKTIRLAAEEFEKYSASDKTSDE